MSEDQQLWIMKSFCPVLVRRLEDEDLRAEKASKMKTLLRRLEEKTSVLGRP